MFQRLTPFALALTLGLSLTACGGDETEVETDPLTTTEDPATADNLSTDPMMADSAMAGDSMMTGGMTGGAGQPTASETATLLRGDLTAAPLAAATANIDGWIARLDGVAAGAEVRTNLQELRRELNDGSIDGAAVGRLLTELGQQTTAAAGSVTGPDGAGLSDLGSALTAAGGQLSGGAAQ